MNHTTIEMFPANDGDSFLIRFDNGKNIVIDMGYKNTFDWHIRKRFEELQSEGQWIDLLVITHVDDDHIIGAIEFIKENKSSSNPYIIRVGEVWHNSYRHLQFNKEKGVNLPTTEKKLLEEIIVSNLSNENVNNNESENISAEKGSTLAAYLYCYGYDSDKWNKSFSEMAVNSDTKQLIQMDKDIKIILLSPDTKKLSSLSRDWLKFLNSQKYNFTITEDIIFDDAYELYYQKLKNDIVYDENEDISQIKQNVGDTLVSLVDKDIEKVQVDQSITNGSAISFIIEYKGEKMLFLADSHDDIIKNNLQKLKESGYETKFDIIKVSHHGSLSNNYEWLELVDGKNYLISTNGAKHKHPDYRFLVRLIRSNTSNEKTVYFNYPLKKAFELDDPILKKRYRYSVVIGSGKKSIII